MKALSVRQPYANQIVNGGKKIEYRTWTTGYRGPLLICSTKTPDPGGEKYPCGCALAVVELVDIRRANGQYEWILRKPKRLKKPFPVRGRQGLFNVDFELEGLEG